MTTKKAVSKGTKTTYICNVTVRHGEDRYYKGEEIDLFTSEAEHLLAAGSIAPKLVPAGKGAAAPAPEKTTPASTDDGTSNN